MIAVHFTLLHNLLLDEFDTQFIESTLRNRLTSTFGRDRPVFTLFGGERA
jgi:hypothetical protein